VRKCFSRRRWVLQLTRATVCSSSTRELLNLDATGKLVKETPDGRRFEVRISESYHSPTRLMVRACTQTRMHASSQEAPNLSPRVRYPRSRYSNYYSPLIFVRRIPLDPPRPASNSDPKVASTDSGKAVCPSSRNSARAYPAEFSSSRENSGLVSSALLNLLGSFGAVGDWNSGPAD
jgi:hypothetical protein